MRSLFVCLVFVTASLTPAWSAAQAPSRRWHLEVLGGLSVFELPTTGDRALPPAGPSLTTSSPTAPSRRVPTWFLGDGSSLVNGANAEFGVAGRIVPLDDVLGTSGLSGANAPVVGLRLRRDLTTRWALDMSAELWTGAADIDQTLIDAVNTSRDSFETAFTDLFSTGPFTGVSVTSDVTMRNRTSRELALIGTARYYLMEGTFAPYVTAGGGLVTRLGDLPSIVLSGSYQFTASANGVAPVTFSESNTLTLRYDQGAGVVGVLGAGVHRQFSPRMGLSVDARVFLGGNTMTLRLDSAPSVTTGTPAGVVASFTTPGVQFSNNSSTGRESSLSGAPLNGFKAFRSSGLQTRFSVTAGLSVRF